MEAVLGAGFSSVVSEDYDFERTKANLDQAGALGIDFVELPIFAMDLIAGGRVLRPQMRRLMNVTDGRPFRYTVHGPIAINFMGDPELIERHIAVGLASIDVAAEIGAVHIILHTGYTPAKGEAEIDEAYARQRDAFFRLGEAAARLNLVVAVENIFPPLSGVHTALPSRLAREIEAIGHPNVRACLDFSHGAIACSAHGADYLAEAAALARVAKHLHIHDSFGDPAQFRTVARSELVAYGLGDLHLPLGWGNLPWHAMMSSFTFEAGAVFNLEIPTPYWYALPDCVIALREMMDVYRNASRLRGT